MTTTVTFNIASDDPELAAAIKAVRVEGDDVLTWQLAVFCCNQQLQNAVARQAIRDHYDTIKMRAKATRQARRGTV